MIIKSLDLENFRNYGRIHFEPDEKITILCGDNAQGKTNIIEAIYLLSYNKSHRGSKDNEMISFLKSESHLKLITEKKGVGYRIDMHLKKDGSKGIAVNSVPVKKAGEIVGLVNCVLFSPENLSLIKEGPNGRRKFMDSKLCITNRLYLENYLQYKKILDQRNRLLKDISENYGLIDTLEVWDYQFIKYAVFLIKERKKFVDEIKETVRKIHYEISGGKEELIIEYEPDTDEKYFYEKLKKTREKDIKNGNTSIGPHRDDIKINIKSDEGIYTDARIFGSQGQQRTAALSLKMSEIEYIKEKTGDYPVLLLDDVLSELDSSRQKFLLDSIKDIQTIITCTGIDDFVKNRFEINRVFYVEKGTIIDAKERTE